MQPAMQRPFILLTFAAVLCGGAAFLHAETREPSAAALAEASIARGDHLVNRVAMCADCHTPRLQDGRLDPERAFHGSPLGFAPTAPMPWMPVAPAIAGLPGYTPEQAVTLLVTGKKVNGQECLPPMPAFRFTEREAKDVVAYLRTLKTPGSE